MHKHLFTTLFLLGAYMLLWVGAGFVGSHGLALLMTLLIAAVYGFGALELLRFRQATSSLTQALASIPEGLADLSSWLAGVHTTLQNPVRLRIEGERIGLPGPALTPYLVGLLVMLGMLGTFLGMVVTLNGAVFALEGTPDLAAIRSAFAAPIKGLGLAFGTSVAGVASSAVLGLLSALSRHERMQAAQVLDGTIATRLRGFSLTHQRQETHRALQTQSQALPAVVDKLQDLMLQMERMSLQLNQRLLSNQESFHSSVHGVYSALAQSVDQSLRDSLSQGAQIAGDSIKPVVEAAMTGIAAQARLMHERTMAGVGQSLQAFNASFDQHAQALLLGVKETYAELQATHSGNDSQRLQAWHGALQSMADSTQMSASKTLGEVTQLLAQSEELVRARIVTEAEWTAQHGTRMDQLGALLRTELGALREAEAVRGQAAVERLGALQTALTSHLTTLGTALEDPITRLIATASEAPRAAAEVIGQLRQEISHSVARDNALLEERSRIMETLNTLLAGINHAAQEQRAVIDALVASSAVSLTEAGQQFATQVERETAKLDDIAAQVSGSALEVSTLGETFGFAVHTFNAANDKLIANLQRIEGAMDKSLARSDDQLAYYVAQAREVIDLSTMSQKEIVEALRRLASRPVGVSVEAA
jgi:hypothetical protein